MKRKLVLTLFIISGLIACSQENHNNLHTNKKGNSVMQKNIEKAAIEKVLQTYEGMLNASDVVGVLSVYADDGVFMPSEAPTAIGKEEVKTAYKHVFNMIKLDIKFQIDEIESFGNIAFARTISRGQVTVLDENVTLPEENRELFVLQKIAYEWKIARYMFNKMNPKG